jgi:hypothetical protein
MSKELTTPPFIQRRPASLSLWQFLSSASAFEAPPHRWRHFFIAASYRNHFEQMAANVFSDSQSETLPKSHLDRHARLHQTARRPRRLRLPNLVPFIQSSGRRPAAPVRQPVTEAV